MELIILNDGLYQLIPVTKQMLVNVQLVTEVDFFDLCDILRLKLTTYHSEINRHVMNDGSGDFFGCMWNTE
jgi:histidinol phosphatase-like enzyme